MIQLEQESTKTTKKGHTQGTFETQKYNLCIDFLDRKKNKESVQNKEDTRKEKKSLLRGDKVVSQ